jgi:hypothetical protein
MDKKQDIPRIRKGDAFVQMDPHPLVFMEVNKVEGSTDSMDFCVVTWYMLTEKGLNVQRRFPMAARDGKFSKFESISRSLLKEAKRLLRQYDADVKLLTVKTEAKSLCYKYTHKLIGLLPDAEVRLPLAQSDENTIVTNQWLDCTEDNYWVEEEPEHNYNYVTLVCMAIESYDDKNDQTITEQFIYLHNNCPYSWNILVNSGAKYMVIEKPNIHKNNT